VASTNGGGGLESQIAEWRSYFRRRQAIREVDVAELEDHLRGQVESLTDVGLAEDEAFLVAVKRMGAVDALSQEFAREHSDRLWRQLVTAPGAAEEGSAERRREATVVLALALAAAVLVKLLDVFGHSLEVNPEFYARNASFTVLPLVVGYFTWKRALTGRTVAALAAVFVVAALVINLYPFRPASDTFWLAVLHLQLALWVVVGIAYAGGRWRDGGRRMDFVRFSGELFIYFVLMALGGGVLTLFTLAIFASIGADAEWFVQEWLLPCGAAGAVIVAAWLVEAKQSVIENMAPVLSRLFTPLFAVVLLMFLGTMAWTGQWIDVEREVLIAFDLLLIVVLGLLLYSISARDSDAPAGGFDWLLVLLVLSALLVDLFALAAIAARISDFGFTPNRVAALGLNVILLVNLAWSALLYGRFLRGRGTFGALEKWQTDHLPVYAAWAATVVLVFPPLFGFA
jgi:hypothetical protein